jgi:hypothetical protein
MKFKHKILSLLFSASAFTAVAAVNTVGADDGISWSEAAEVTAYEMQAGCRGIKPALTESGWFPAGTGWVNATVTDCKFLNMDYHAADGRWYPSFLMVALTLPVCVPSIEEPASYGSPAVLYFKSWVDNQGCLLANTIAGTQFRLHDRLSSHEEGLVIQSHRDSVYLLPINMVWGLWAEKSYVQISIGNGPHSTINGSGN